MAENMMVLSPDSDTHAGCVPPPVLLLTPQTAWALTGFDFAWTKLWQLQFDQPARVDFISTQLVHLMSVAI